MIRIKIDWRDERKFKDLIKYIDSNLIYGQAQEKIRVVAHHSADHMRETISSSKKRHSTGNNLENAITAELIDDVGGIKYGIGNINKLKSDAPYWEVIDQGGYVPYSTAKGAPLGSFEGDAPAGSGNQNWEKSGDKGFFMKPKNPIEGINYVGKAINNMQKELKKTMEDLGGKFIEDLAKESK